MQQHVEGAEWCWQKPFCTTAVGFPHHSSALHCRTVAQTKDFFDNSYTAVYDIRNWPYFGEGYEYIELVKYIYIRSSSYFAGVSDFSEATMNEISNFKYYFVYRGLVLYFYNFAHWYEYQQSAVLRIMLLVVGGGGKHAWKRRICLWYTKYFVSYYTGTCTCTLYHVSSTSTTYVYPRHTLFQINAAFSLRVRTYSILLYFGCYNTHTGASCVVVLNKIMTAVQNNWCGDTILDKIYILWWTPATLCFHVQ